MTIRIYPSRLPGEPLETHHHRAMTLHAWFTANVDGYTQDRLQPVAAVVNGRPVKSDNWPVCHIAPDDDVRLYPTPYGTGLEIAAWIAVAVSVATAAYTIFAMQGLGSSSSSVGSGTSLDLNPAKANSAALGDPIREVFGKYRIYPDYVVAPVGRFDADDPEKYVMNLFVSLGVGTFSFTEGDMRVGDTPVSSLGDGFSYSLFQPGADVSGDERTENWFNSTEVGGTSSGSGLDMGTTAPDTDEILADSVTVAGGSVTFNNLITDDDDDSTDDDNQLPDSWTEGAAITLVVPDSFTVATSGQHSLITGNSVAEIAPYTGMPVSLTYNSITYSLFIASYTAATADEQASITLAYGSASGAAFSGIPDGSQRLSLSHADSEYKLLSIDGATVTVARLLAGAEDDSWPGFSARTALDFQATGINDSDTWLGPFLACPENETTDCFEVNFSFPNGVCGFNSSGSKQIRHVGWELQYRVYSSGKNWTSITGTFAQKNINGLGFTERVVLDTAGLVEVRCRRTNEQGSNNARDSMYWQALRGRLTARPSSYSGVTTMAVSVVTGGKLAAQSDRRINMVATRDYARGTARTVSGALYHILDNLGIAADDSTIDALEANYWTPRQEFFDFSTDSDDTSALDILQKITNAGMSYFLLSDGMASAGREGVKAWTGAITAQDTVEELKTSFTMPSQDDYDGVDVTYINGSTWAEETVQCRTSDNPTASKIESYTLDGVLDKDRAYRIGMRRLMGYIHQKLTHSTTTELDALCYQYMDRIVLTDDIPGHDTLSCLVTSASSDGSTLTLGLSEPPDWTFTNPRCLIRLQDGGATALLVPTRVDDFTLSVPLTAALRFDEWDMDDPAIEPPRLVFCSSEKVGYDALLTEIAPSSDGTCEVTAAQYTPLKYQYDDATYPGDVS